MDVPNQPGTPNRSMRIPDDIWDAVQRLAEDRSVTATDIIIRALRRYLREQDGRG